MLTAMPMAAIENIASIFNKRNVFAARAPAILPKQLIEAMAKIAKMAIIFSCHIDSIPLEGFTPKWVAEFQIYVYSRCYYRF